MTKVSVNYFDSNQTGDIISRMSYDIDTIATSLSADLLNMITSVITVVVSFIMMLITSPLLLGIFFITIPVSFIVTNSLSKVIKKRLRIRNQQLGQMNGYAEEMISAQKTIQSYVQEEAIYQRFEVQNQDAAEKSYQAGYYSTIVGPSVNFINNLGMALVGTAVALQFWINCVGEHFDTLLRRFSGPINQMSNLVADINRLAAAEKYSLPRSKDETKDIENANRRYYQRTCCLIM